MNTTNTCPFYARGRCGCECPIEGGIFHHKIMVPSHPHCILPPLTRLDVVYYQRLGLLSIGGYLLGIHHVGWGAHFWREMKDSLVDMHILLTMPTTIVFFILP